jgi:hypothetical protein
MVDTGRDVAWTLEPAELKVRACTKGMHENGKPRSLAVVQT